MNAPKLPPLPEPAGALFHGPNERGQFHCFAWSADQMRAYASAAVKAALNVQGAPEPMSDSEFVDIFKAWRDGPLYVHIGRSVERAVSDRWRAALAAAVADAVSAALEARAVECEAMIDEAEQKRANKAAEAAIKSRASARDQIDRMSHESTVSLFNAAIRRCVAVIRRPTQPTQGATDAPGA